MYHFSHSDYYIDRRSERDLCFDFPGDEILIAGLHTMQTHFWNNNINIDIPIMPVMNAAHYLVAYMMATTCSGDQGEYDTLAYMSVGHDKQMYLLTMVVLAAMLKRTTGFRARNCRNVILENRTEDFDEGVTLYERFLSSAEEHFTEEDFLIDVPALIAQNTQLEYENTQLRYQITQMENQQNNQYNNCVVYNAPVYNTTNNNYAQTQSTEDVEPVTEDVPTDLFKYIHVEVTDDKERAQIHKMVRNIVQLPKMQQVCEELYKLMKSRKVLCTINPESMLAELRRIGLPSADVNGFSDKNFYHYYQAPKLD